MTRQKKYSLSELSKLINLPFEGDPNVVISGVGTLQQATEHQITFLDNPIYKKYLTETKAAAVVLSAENKTLSVIPALISKNPYLDFAKILRLFDERSLPDIGIHPTAVVGKNCKIDSSARIGAFCFIGDNSEIGAESCLWPRVTLYDSTLIGQHVMIHSGAVLGSDGFGNARDGFTWVKVPQLGRVMIKNNVEIGANTTIDRGAIDDTIIEEGARIDNLVQIAHNVKIGAHTAIAGCVAIAGSVTIGKHCLIGGGAGINGHLEICDGVMLTAMTGVSKSITEPGIYSAGTVSQKNLAWRKMTVRLRHLDELFDRVERLEKLEKFEKEEIK
ncbi:MAG TPA: UDP-3-O-(3-hydroxymyristoyl)glucosamine N-acyltransferase [Gammaproteobacteria bacterium]|nr:UDP-3-O-(3-hydroxymyristoyl)glucosamine N-acyltransferase [Gammaproteobacteria bacterium]